LIFIKNVLAENCRISGDCKTVADDYCGSSIVGPINLRWQGRWGLIPERWSSKDHGSEHECGWGWQYQTWHHHGDHRISAGDRRHGRSDRFPGKVKLPYQPHILPNTYLILPFAQTAGIVYKWFRDKFAQEEIKKPVIWNRV